MLEVAAGLWLTSFDKVELGAPVGALTVVDVLHVAGVLVRSCVQSDAVSLKRLQRLWVKGGKGVLNSQNNSISVIQKGT